MGASFGAVASVYGAHRHPERIGRLLIQSGSFYYWNVVHTPSLFEPFDEWDRIGLFLEGEFFPDGFARPMRIFHSCGTFEGILTRNRAFADSLRELGHDVCYRESHDGHNWVSWRDHFGEGLAHLFPPRSDPQPTD
jgi:enterochelin esterase-like enzyme